MRQTPKNRFLKLSGLYILAILLGLVIRIIFPEIKIHGVLFYFIILLGLLVYIKKEKCEYRSWFQKPQKEGCGQIAIAILVTLWQTVIVTALSVLIYQEGGGEKFVFEIFPCLTTCLLAPVTEEIVCRGIIIDILKEKHGKAFTITVSALIFYVIHGNPFNVGSFLFGLCAGWGALTAKSIVPGIVIHMCWNGIVYFLPLILVL